MADGIYTHTHTKENWIELVAQEFVQSLSTTIQNVFGYVRFIQRQINGEVHMRLCLSGVANVTNEYQLYIHIHTFTYDNNVC